jgi:hypothetical protein
MSSGRVVISSLTGKPMPWEDDDEDAQEEGKDTAHEAELRRDVPPHWGTGA